MLVYLRGFEIAETYLKWKKKDEKKIFTESDNYVDKLNQNHESPHVRTFKRSKMVQKLTIHWEVESRFLDNFLDLEIRVSF